MASMYFWPSVSIKRGANLIVARKVVRAEYDWTFGHLLTVINSSWLNVSVTRVAVSKNEQFVDPVHDLPLDSPVQLCQQYGNNICYYLAPQNTVEESSKHRKNAFEVLMSSSKERKRPGKAETSGTHQFKSLLII